MHSTDHTVEIDGNEYDGDKLRSLAQRDTPAAIIAHAVLQEYGHGVYEPADARDTAPVAGD